MIFSLPRLIRTKMEKLNAGSFTATAFTICRQNPNDKEDKNSFLFFSLLADNQLIKHQINQYLIYLQKSMKEEKLTITVQTSDMLREQSKKRQDKFYQWMCEFLISQKQNSIIYTKFLNEGVNKFPLGKGFALIGKNCEKANCYRFVDFSELAAFQDSLVSFLSGQRKNYICSNCKKQYSSTLQILYDSALNGFFEYNISQKDLKKYKYIEITKDNNIYLPTETTFSQIVNKARIRILSELYPEIVGESSEGKTLKVQTMKIVSQTENKLQHLHIEKGKNSHRTLNQNQMIMCSSYCDERNLNIPIKLVMMHYKDGKTSFTSLKTNLMPTKERFIEFFCEKTLTFYWLGISGVLFRTTLSEDYSFSKNELQVQKMGQLTGKDISMKFHHSSCFLYVVNRNIYIIQGTQREQYLTILKGTIHEEKPIILKSIFPKTIIFRKGYIAALEDQQCIAIIGGYNSTNQKDKCIKFLDTINLKKADEEHQRVQFKVCKKDMNLFNFSFPTSMAILQSHLILWGTDKKGLLVIVPLDNTNEAEAITSLIGFTKDECLNPNKKGSIQIKKGNLMIMREMNRFGNFATLKINKCYEQFLVSSSYNYR